MVVTLLVLFVFLNLYYPLKNGVSYTKDDHYFKMFNKVSLISCRNLSRKTYMNLTINIYYQ